MIKPSNKTKGSKKRGHCHLNKQDRKEEIAIECYIQCDRCRDTGIPVRKGKDRNLVLKSHQRFCTTGVKRYRHGTHIKHEADEMENKGDDVDAVENEDDEDCKMEHEDTSHDDIAPNTTLTRSSKSWYYDFQKKLEKEYKRDLTINKRKGDDKPASVEDTLDIYNFAINVNMSNTETDGLLDLFHRIHKNHNISVPLPHNHKTLQRQCGGIISESNDKCVFRLLQWEYSLDERVFPEDHKDVTTAYSYDIKEIISEALLNMDPSKFVRIPDNRSLDNGERIYEEYTTGDHFKLLSEAVKKKNSNDTALCIGLTLDGTQTYSGKRTFTPVYIFVLNAFDNCFQMILLGYAPTDELPYTRGDIENGLYETYPRRNNRKTGKKNS